MENVTSDLIKCEVLSDAVLLEIFDTTEFEELLGFAEMNLRFNRLITRYYAINKFRIHEKLIQLHPLMNSRKMIEFNNDVIRICDPMIFTRILMNFGQSISRIQITHNYDDNLTNSIGEHINKYCDESLTELSLKFNKNLNVSWQKPFKQLNKFHVEMLTFNRENNMNLTNIFPSLRHLTFQLINPSVLRCFAQHMSQLKYVQFPIQYSHNEIEFYKEFMAVNQQIRDIHIILEGDDFDLLRLTNEILPNLEGLRLTTEFEYVLNDTRPILFKNVKSFVLCSSAYNLDFLNDFPILFEQLLSFEISAPFMSTNKWIKFIDRNNKLDKLNIHWMLDLNEWTMIVDNLPNLAGVKTKWQSNYEENGLINLMSRETKLKKVTFVIGLLKVNSTALCDLLFPRWQIERKLDSLKEITFIRNDQNAIRWIHIIYSMIESSIKYLDLVDITDKMGDAKIYSNKSLRSH